MDGCDIAMLPLVMKRISTEPDTRIRRELVRKLDVFGVHAIEPMLDLLGSMDAEISTLHALLITLLRRSKRDALPIITQAIQGRTARRQLGAVTALSALYPPKTVLPLIEPCLNHKRPQVRFVAVQAFSVTDDLTIATRLITMLSTDLNADVRVVARRTAMEIYRNAGKRAPKLPTSRSIAHTPWPLDLDGPLPVPFEHPYPWFIDERDPLERGEE